MKRFLQGTSITLAVIFALVVVVGCLNLIFSDVTLRRILEIEPLVRTNSRYLEPQYSKETGVYFELPNDDPDYEFVILQITDVHLGGGAVSHIADNRAVDAIEALVRYVEPHLIIATGDVLHAMPFLTLSFNNFTPARLFATLMDRLAVPWTVALGNHESPWYNYFSRGRIAQIFEDSEHSIFSSAPDIMGYGNHVVNIKADGQIVQALVIMDTNDYRGFGLRDYDTFHECQIAWYEDTIRTLNDWNIANGAVADSMIRSIMFYHIPISEMRYAYQERYDQDSLTVRNFEGLSFGNYSGSPPAPVGSGAAYSDMFERAVNLRSTHAMFFGHNHFNTFSMQINGGINVGEEGEWWIHMAFGGSIDHLAFFWANRQHPQRGGNIIKINRDTTFSHTWVQLYYPEYGEFIREARTIEVG